MIEFTADLPMSTARQTFRALGRQVLRDPQNVSLHTARLTSGLALSGTEPVQGALADFLFGCQQADIRVKQEAFASVRNRLRPVIQRWFEPYVSASSFPACCTMATRWSVLVGPSLDVPRRVLRCSTDNSRQLAADALAAWRKGEENTQEGFFEHCCVCRDTLAFMLARRVILKERGELPPRWRAVCLSLQQAVLT